MDNNLFDLDSVKPPDDNENNDGYLDRQNEFLRWEINFFGVVILILLCIFVLLS